MDRTAAEKKPPPLTAAEQSLVQKYLEKYETPMKLIMRRNPRYVQRLLAIGWDWCDVEQQAMLGVFDAARLYNPNLNILFETFAYKWSTFPLRHALDDSRRKKRTPTGKVISLHLKAVDGAGRQRVIELPAPPPAPDRTVPPQLKDAITRLNPRERQVISRRFGLGGQTPMMLKEIGADIGVTRERVRQIEERALQKLRDYLERKLGEDVFP